MQLVNGGLSIHTWAGFPADPPTPLYLLRSCLLTYGLPDLLYPVPFLILPVFRKTWKLQISLGSVFPDVGLCLWH